MAEAGKRHKAHECVRRTVTEDLCVIKERRNDFHFIFGLWQSTDTLEAINHSQVSILSPFSFHTSRTPYETEHACELGICRRRQPQDSMQTLYLLFYYFTFIFYNKKSECVINMY